MRGSESRMNAAVHFVEHLNRFPAQGQEFFVRGQGHGSVLRPMVLFYRLMRQGADTHRYPKALPFAVSCLSSASIILMIKNAGTEGWPANFALQLACVLELDTTA